MQIPNPFSDQYAPARPTAAPEPRGKAGGRACRRTGESTVASLTAKPLGRRRDQFLFPERACHFCLAHCSECRADIWPFVYRQWSFVWSSPAGALMAARWCCRAFGLAVALRGEGPCDEAVRSEPARSGQPAAGPKAGEGQGGRVLSDCGRNPALFGEAVDPGPLAPAARLDQFHEVASFDQNVPCPLDTAAVPRWVLRFGHGGRCNGEA